MSVGTFVEHPEDATTYKFPYLRWDGRAGRWARDAKVVRYAPSYDAAVDQFWLDEDRSKVLLAGALHADIREEDYGRWTYGDEPEFTSHELAETLGDFAKQPGELEPYTVFGVWDTGDGWRRNATMVTAKNFVHAECLVRDANQPGRYLVAAVYAGDWTSQDRGEYEFATRSGRPPGSPEERELDETDQVLRGRGPWWRRLVGLVRGSR